ncbi:DUF2141 domain-containing protein [Cesiribacter sp. SM1]|uniref:DUF2141 domain-containing protein n=1 Tax=Cesiribacter sp. SM1 TaxID=2861196 RepID=UPI001CD2B17D|nr:DUF2141 domain-containing protein [Cesiribacter sp. SM1]
MEKSREKKPGPGFRGWLVVLAGILVLSTAAAWQKNEATHSIIVKVEGARNNKGVIRLALFNKGEGFPTDGKKAIRNITVPASEGAVQMVVEGLPAGRYAISLLHDENENGNLDTNVVGYPKEGYGASNNNLPTFRAPNFDEAAFDLKSARQELIVRLRY